MNFFKSIFGSEKEENHPSLDWNPLVAISQLETIKEESDTICVLIFKHSTRCGISSFVLRNFESTYNIASQDAKLYFLDILSYREVSNAVANTFDVLHESPQLLIVKDKKVVYSESHGHIDAETIMEFINFRK